ncbi:Uncharacterised protein [Vibrio cholerae]|nr:Uncharacterised protein [Vibrio cholerae]CSI55366.1 Uncharacterised protein [Vibrio cholerae]CSI58652.1 Uncharacterised protein [Vibrio cholerae]
MAQPTWLNKSRQSTILIDVGEMESMLVPNTSRILPRFRTVR